MDCLPWKPVRAMNRDIRGSVTAHFQNQPLSQGLVMLAENSGWFFVSRALRTQQASSL
jgi:hypothetical protein